MHPVFCLFSCNCLKSWFHHLLCCWSELWPTFALIGVVSVCMGGLSLEVWKKAKTPFLFSWTVNRIWRAQTFFQVISLSWKWENEGFYLCWPCHCVLALILCEKWHIRKCYKALKFTDSCIFFLYFYSIDMLMLLVFFFNKLFCNNLANSYVCQIRKQIPSTISMLSAHVRAQTTSPNEPKDYFWNSILSIYLSINYHEAKTITEKCGNQKREEEWGHSRAWRW